MPAAGEMINRARTHLRSASTIAATDPTLALSACHDAARQAISAHMRAGGYRVANETGAHRTVIEYAEAVLAGVISGDDRVALDDLRRDRHTAEYGDFGAVRTSLRRACSPAPTVWRGPPEGNSLYSGKCRRLQKGGTPHARRNHSAHHRPS